MKKKLMKKNKIFLMFAAIVVASILSSCSALKYSRPEDLKQDGLYGSMAQESESPTLATLSWREIYTDPYLQALIEEALQQNVDLRIQQWAVQQAEVACTSGKLAFLPSLTLSPSGSYTTNAGWAYQVPATLGWELDILRKSRALQMNNANLALQQDDLQAIQSRLVANVASMYYQLLSLDETNALLDEAILVMNEMVYAMESMMEAGLTDGVAVNRFKANTRDYEIQKMTMQYNIQQAEVAMCQLLGREPGNIERGKLADCAMPENLSVGLSAQLLDNRPDVRSAERSLEYYFHGIGYARSNFYPKISLSAEAIFNGNFVAQFIGGLVQPIFAQYKTIAALKVAQADYERAKLAYQQTLIDAGSEVVLALSQCTTAKAKKQSRLQQIEECKKAVDQSRTQMFNGECTYLDVLTAQTTYFEKQAGFINDSFEELEGVVNLYLALGGG
ncbi:MAG: TolC family protein, partial [Bacteroidales bacterium]|nr:TolC family protein [Bacteroidales bacterium]